jgi:hypothetical protein
MTESIFQQYYEEHKRFYEPFEDRCETEDNVGMVDVIIPLLHTNELWRANLLSIYRNIPVRRLIIGNAGCSEQALKLLKEFPRVDIYDHVGYSLGYSIKKMIEEVNTEWFVYLHSDVFIPQHWFDKMASYQDQYDWFECYQKQTYLVEHLADYGPYKTRPGGGSHMGRKEAFLGAIGDIQDDYLYRTEDYAFIDRIQKNGYKYGVVNTYHYHQIMHRSDSKDREIVDIKLDVKLSKYEEKRTWEMQFWAVIKYFEPTSENLQRLAIFDAIDHLIALEEFNWAKIRPMIELRNPWVWHIQKYLYIRRPLQLIFKSCAKAGIAIYHKV